MIVFGIPNAGAVQRGALVVDHGPAVIHPRTAAKVRLDGDRAVKWARRGFVELASFQIVNKLSMLARRPSMWQLETVHLL